MAKPVGMALAGPLLDYMKADPAKQEGRAILLVTVDDDGWPHVALLSSWEVYATDDQNVKVATYLGTKTTANLKKNGKATLVVFAGGNAYYVKGSARMVREHLRSDPANSLFNVEVLTVLEDSFPGVTMTGASYRGNTGEEHGPLYQEIANEGP